MFQFLASTESDFFFPGSTAFSWTSSDSNDNGRHSPNSNIERFINKNHGVDFDPANKVIGKNEYA